jgi:hypothetical protein
VEERNGESPSRNSSGGIDPNLVHFDKNEGRGRPFQAKISDTTPPCKRSPLKAASSGTGLALDLWRYCGQSFVSISTPEKTSRRDPAHRILSKTSQMCENISDQSHERCRVVKKLFVAAQCCL